MQAAHLVHDVKRARSFACAAGNAGAYGAPTPCKGLDPGLYAVLADGDAAVRFTQDGTFRVDGSGFKVEVPVRALLPLSILVEGPVAVAARTTACVVWFVPLLAVDAATGRLVEVKCER